MEETVWYLTIQETISVRVEVSVVKKFRLVWPGFVYVKPV
jgi:hypothetical protein